MWYFFAKNYNGNWVYLFKIYTQNQIDFYSKSYLEMKTGGMEMVDGQLKQAGTNKWSEVLFVEYDKLPFPNKLSVFIPKEDQGVQEKLKELNHEYSTV